MQFSKKLVLSDSFDIFIQEQASQKKIGSLMVKAVPSIHSHN